MCGIAGYANLLITNTQLKHMTDAIAHRGPDGEGFYFDKSNLVGLGHRRLAIIDVGPSGHQPMTYEDSGYWLTYNGEIYNYIELREELAKLGYKFYTNSDTEVLLVAYIAWGVESFKKLNGMFAFAIYDERKKQLVLCRDQYAIKPLYYYSENNSIVFGSEVKAFTPLSKHLNLEINTDFIHSNIVNHVNSLSVGLTLYKKVAILQPGHYLLFNFSDIQIKKWWNHLDYIRTIPRRFSDQIEEFHYLLTDACRIRLRSDVPIGISLSGGVDSSSIAAILSKMSDSVSGFNYKFSEKHLDESPLIKQLLDTNHIKCHFVNESDRYFDNDSMDSELYHYEGIPKTILPSTASHIFRAQNQNQIKVSIDGHAADEMLGGYYWYTSAIRKECNLFSLQFYYCLFQQKAMGGATEKYFYLREILSKTPQVLQLIRKVRGRKTPVGHSSFVEPFVYSTMYSAPKTEYPDSWSLFKKILFQSFCDTTLPSTLKSFDLYSMQHSVEMRIPFLDPRLVNFCLSLPDEAKISKGYSKRILREAMRGLLPDPIRLNKYKTPFQNTPIWTLLKKNDDWIQNVLLDKNPLESIFSMQKLKEFYEKMRCNQFVTWSDMALFCACLNATRLVNLFEKNAILTPRS